MESLFFFFTAEEIEELRVKGKQTGGVKMRSFLRSLHQISPLMLSDRGVWCCVMSVPHPRGLLSETRSPPHVRHSWC